MSVPSSIYKLKLLQNLRLSGCCKLKELPPPLVVLCSSISYLNLSNCVSMTDIADHVMVGLSSLKEIDLSGTMIDSIPPSIKQVSGLTFLNVKSCKQLQSLPELPCLLRELRANVCMNLKTVSGSMTTLTQGLDQICDPELVHRNEEHTFCQCLNLDENARSSIMEDAKLRIMRMATAVISKRRDKSSISLSLTTHTL